MLNYFIYILLKIIYLSFESDLEEIIKEYKSIFESVESDASKGVNVSKIFLPDIKKNLETLKMISKSNLSKLIWIKGNEIKIDLINGKKNYMSIYKFHFS